MFNGDKIAKSSFLMGVLIGAVVFIFVGYDLGVTKMQKIAVSKDVAYYDSRTKEFKYINRLFNE